jgi:nucleoside-triphosphatase THEP1
VGKTTVCQAVAELARRRGYRPGGVITPALYACPELALSEARPEFRRRVEGQSRRDSHGVKVGFEVVDVGSGERWPLARTDDPSTSRRGKRSPEQSRRIVEPSGQRRQLDGPRVGPYSFDPDGLARALRVLREAISAQCDLLVIDEIGPLELEQGEGFAPILDLLPVEAPMHTLIVVRPALLDPLLRYLRDTQCSVFSVTEENRDELPLRIVEKLWGNEVALCSVIRDFRAFRDLGDDD